MIDLDFGAITQAMRVPLKFFKLESSLWLIIDLFYVISYVAVFLVLFERGAHIWLQYRLIDVTLSLRNIVGHIKAVIRF